MIKNNRNIQIQHALRIIEHNEQCCITDDVQCTDCSIIFSDCNQVRALAKAKEYISSLSIEELLEV